MDLREDPQLMEKYPQPIPIISKVVGPLQGYIRRPSHGEGRDGEIERYLTYDIIRNGRHWRHKNYDLIRKIISEA
jgi:hypothetical protein